MSIRTKTRNRLLLLLAVSVAGGGGLVGAYYVRRGYLNAGALRARESGMAAVKAGDYAGGLSDLGRYLGRFSNRPEQFEERYAEALFNYALSRQMIEAPKMAHYVTAVSLWKRYLAIHSENAEARHHLLDAQLGLGWYPEALDTAEGILKTEPKDLKSLTVKAEMLYRQRKYPEALAAAQAWAAAYPHDLDAHLTVVQALTVQDQEHAVENFAKYAAERRAGEPNEPCFVLLASMAANRGLDLKDKKAQGEKLAQSAKLALELAARDLADSKIIGRLTHQLDTLWVQSILIGNEKELGLSGKSLDLARKSMDAHPDDLEFQRLYALRLIQSGRFRETEALLAKVTPETASADGRLLALKALVEFSLGLQKEGEALVAAAAQRGKQDQALAALCDALRAVCVAPAEESAAMADLQAAVNNPAVKPEDCKAKLRAFVLARSEDTAALADLKAILNDSAANRADIKAKVDAYVLAWNKTWQETCQTAAAKAPGDPLVSDLLGEASYRAGDADAAAKALARTLEVAPAWVQVHVRLAQLAVTLRQAQGALQYADIARGLAPDDPNVLAIDTFVNAAVASPGQAGQIDKALALLKELELRFADRLAPDTRQQIAVQLSRLGKTDEAIQLLAAALPSAAQTQISTTPSTQPLVSPRLGNDALLLARLYAGQKRYQEAQGLFDQLLANNPTVDVIMYAADLAGTLGQEDKVRQIIGKLDALQPLPGGREMVWADYYSRHGTPQQALDNWKAALKANPANSAAWRLLLAFCLKTGKTDPFDGPAAFLTNFSEARKAAADNTAFAFLARLQDTAGRKTGAQTPSVLEEMCQDNFLRPLVVALLDASGTDDAAAKTVTQCLDALAESQKNIDALPALDAAAIRPIQDKLIPVLQKLVDDNPDVLPVQNFLAAFYGLTQRYDQCVAMASRAMRAFPNDPGTPAQTAFRVLAAAGRWDDALTVAKEWRQRSLAQPMAADLALADAYLNLRKPADALAQLADPYLNEIKQGKKTPNDYDQVYIRYLQALLNSSQTDAAVQAATPLFQDRRWRILWMQLMVALPDDKAAAASLENLNAVIPADANDERVTLAVAWNVMFARTKAQAYETKAFGLLDALNGADASRQFLQDFAKRMLAAPQNNADGVVLWAHWRFAKASADDAQKSLLPLLDSLNGRLTWINLAADIPDPTTAAQWLDAAATALNTATDPAPAMIAQKFQLAEALKVLADRANMPAALKTSCLKTAATLLEPIPSENGANQTPQTLLAMIYEDQENYAAGAGVYRKMLKSKADDVIALNNLATLLAKMKQPVDGPEALALIAQAIKLQPKVTSFYDTQASVYALLTQDYPKALQSIQQAISLEPANLDWRVSRIWILALSGQRTTATAEFSQLKKDQDLNQLSADSRQKLQDAGLQ